jgi:hypothetical protein
MVFVVALLWQLEREMASLSRDAGRRPAGK